MSREPLWQTIAGCVVLAVFVGMTAAIVAASVCSACYSFGWLRWESVFPAACWAGTSACAVVLAMGAWAWRSR